MITTVITSYSIHYTKLYEEGPGHEAPLQAGREACTATTSQHRRLHFGNDVGRRRLFSDDFLERFVAAALDVVLQPPGTVAVETSRSEDELWNFACFVHKKTQDDKLPPFHRDAGDPEESFRIMSKQRLQSSRRRFLQAAGGAALARITSYNVCYTKLLRV